MTIAALAARLVLAGVFAVAACAKLGDRRGTREAVVSFGAPETLAAPLALLLPAAELAAAALLLPAGSARSGLVLSLGLLVLFTGALALSLARGRTPECHCFGRLHSEPASWRTLLRNVGLAGVAAFGLAANGERSAVAWVGRLAGEEAMLLAIGLGMLMLVAAGGVAFVTLLRSYGKVLVRLERIEHQLAARGIELEELEANVELGLEPGSAAPVFAGLDELLAPGLPVALLFTSPHCGPCKTLMPRAAAWQREHAAALTVAFAVGGPADAARAEAAELGLEHVVLDERLEIYDAYLANGTPSAVLISPDGRIASGLAAGPDWIEQLVARALLPEPGLAVGAEPPDLEVLSLDGGSVALSDLRGRETLLLFWNPDCGYCRAMHADLLEWERAADEDDPRLVIVSSGDPDRTRADGFDSLVLIDSDFAVGGAFAAGGTPTAVLLGADGRVASPLASGADAVLTLVH